MLNLQFTCTLLTADTFQWAIQESEDIQIVRRNYIPGWTPEETVDPLNPPDGSLFYEEDPCAPDSPIDVTWEFSCSGVDPTSAPFCSSAGSFETGAYSDVASSAVVNTIDLPTGATFSRKWIINFPNLMQADANNPQYPFITRTHIYVDGYPNLSV